MQPLARTSPPNQIRLTNRNAAGVGLTVHIRVLTSYVRPDERQFVFIVAVCGEQEYAIIETAELSEETEIHLQT